jgi:uncharacterized protein
MTHSRPGPQLISDIRRKYEIAFVLATAAGKFVFMDFLNWKLPFVAITIVGWAAYVASRNRRGGNVLSYWGFRIDNFREVIMMILPFGIVSVIAFFAVGYLRDTIHLSWHIFPILILYPLWGVIQQFLVIALVAGNLQDLKKNRVNKFIIITITALLFGVIHYPYYWLMAGTFALALLYGFIYLKNRNLYVMGLFHGWLGALFFYTVVDRDPFAEVFGRFFN